jgi:hypothetical protein
MPGPTSTLGHLVGAWSTCPARAYSPFLPRVNPMLKMNSSISRFSSRSANSALWLLATVTASVPGCAEADDVGTMDQDMAGEAAIIAAKAQAQHEHAETLGGLKEIVANAEQARSRSAQHAVLADLDDSALAALPSKDDNLCGFARMSPWLRYVFAGGQVQGALGIGVGAGIEFAFDLKRREMIMTGQAKLSASMFNLGHQATAYAGAAWPLNQGVDDLELLMREPRVGATGAIGFGGSVGAELWLTVASRKEGTPNLAGFSVGGGRGDIFQVAPALTLGAVPMTNLADSILSDAVDRVLQGEEGSRVIQFASDEDLVLAAVEIFPPSYVLRLIAPAVSYRNLAEDFKRLTGSTLQFACDVLSP